MDKWNVIYTNVIKMLYSVVNQIIMRKVLLAALMLFSIVARAQERSFTGLAIFQLGSDTVVLYNYAATVRIKIGITNDSQSVLLGKFDKAETAVVYRLLRNADNAKNYSNMSCCPDCHEFYVSLFKAENVLMQRITLKYYKNKLIYVECQLSKKLLDDVSAKFGKPATSTKKDTISCGTNGNIQKLVGETLTIPWRIQNVVVRGIMQRTYNERCQPQYHGTFIYAIDDQFAAACEEEAKKKAQQVN